MAIDYKSAGVDVEAGYEAVKLMKQYVSKTYNDKVLFGIGSFGGFYDLGNGDVLVSGTDGVGTKLKYAFTLDKHDTVGIDCVAMCVNDIICQGAKPLFFLDYIAIPKLIPEKVASIVKGVAEGCMQANCALIGGETAEMSGFYADGEYDIAGFAVGIVKKDKIINGSDIKSGDKLIGIKSSGIHSNGYTLVRKLFSSDEDIQKYGETLLTPTKIYVKTILGLIEKIKVKGIANITGGGFIENVPRMLPDGVAAKIDLNSYALPEIFKEMQARAGLSDEKMCNTFNMGIGMVLCVAESDVKATLDYLGDEGVLLGETVSGSGVILERSK